MKHAGLIPTFQGARGLFRWFKLLWLLANKGTIFFNLRGVDPKLRRKTLALAFISDTPPGETKPRILLQGTVLNAGEVRELVADAKSRTSYDGRTFDPEEV